MIRNSILIFILFSSGFCLKTGAQHMSSIVENAPKYENVEIYSDIILSRNPSYQPQAYKNILLKSDAPVEINQSFLNILNQAGFNAILTSDIFTEPRVYPVLEIDSIIRARDIELYLLLKYTPEKVKSDAGAMKVSLYITFKDLKSAREPFYIINGKAFGKNNSELVLSEEIFSNTIRELIFRDLIFSKN